MNQDPFVSIVIPTFNHAHLIQKCLQSVINQTYQNFEVIVVNNYSTDNTIEVIESFHDNRIKLINYQNQGFIGVARNIGIEASKGDYIAFLDSDDLWYPQKLERSLIEMKKQNADVFCNDMLAVQEGKIHFTMYTGPANERMFEQLLFQGNCMVLSAGVVSRKVIDKIKGFTNDPTMLTCEDFDFWLRAAKEGFKFAFSNEVMGVYLIHSGNTSRSAERSYNSATSVVRHHFNSIESSFYNRIQLRKSIAHHQYSAARNYHNSGVRTNAFKYYFKSIKTYPFHLKVYLFLFVLMIENKWTYGPIEKIIGVLRRLNSKRHLVSPKKVL